MKNTHHLIRSIFAITATFLLAGCATKTVTINSFPEGAAIFLDGQLAGTAPVRKQLRFDPPSKAYVAVARQSGFQDGTATITYKPKTQTEYSVILKKFRKTARITSVPEGVTVFLNGQQAGITPLTKELVFDSTEQQFDLTLCKEGYEDGAVTITYEPKAQTEYSVVLKKFKKKARVTSAPEGAAVFLNGQQAGITPLTKELVFDSTEQQFDLTLCKEGYEDGKGKITYEPKTQTEYSVVLKKFRKTVRITSVPEGATVFLNGQQAGITPLTKELVFDSTEQQFDFTVCKENCVDGKGKIAYLPTEKTEYPVDLEPIKVVPIELIKVEPVRTEKGVKLAWTRKPTLAYLEVIERSPNVSSVTKVTANEDPAVRIGPPVLSPTEDILLFEEFVEEEKGSMYSNIQKQKVGSSAKTRLTYGKYQDLSPAFTRDGKRVVFSSNRASANQTLWIVKADKPGGLSKLTNTQAEDFSPSVSPDDQFVVYVSNPPSAEEPQIWTVPLDAALLTQLREGESPQASPNGKSILFIRQDKITKVKQLWLMGIDGAEETQLTQNTDFDIIDARWSPDGKWIAYASKEGRDSEQLRNFDIWLMAADGSKHTQLTTNGSWDDSPCWDAKGETIYFRSNRGGVWNIWRFKPILSTQ